MTKNPFVNAIAASLYIILIVSVLFNAPKFEDKHTILAPIAMLSLFTLSAAVMGYLFVCEPFVLYLDGKKREGIAFFLKTTVFFAVITASIFLLLFLLF